MAEYSQRYNDVIKRIMTIMIKIVTRRGGWKGEDGGGQIVNHAVVETDNVNR
jgi:hypothetical protein